MAPFVFLARSARAELIVAHFWKISRLLRRGEIGGGQAILFQRAGPKKAEFPIRFLVIGLILFRPLFAAK